MNTLKLTALAVLITFGAVSAQEVEKRMAVKVVVANDESGDATEIDWVSNDMDFDMQDLAVGETRVIDSESGKSVTVTRVDDGFSFDIDGQTIVMPDMGAHGSHMAFIGEPGEPAAPMDVDVQVIRGSHVMQAHHPEGVTIVSGQPLDDSVKESIRSVLISAGNNEEVTFIDGSETGKHVMVKKIKITE